MRSKTIALLLVLGLSSILGACGTNTTSPAPEASPTASPDASPSPTTTP
jgi:hypothetical protein